MVLFFLGIEIKEAGDLLGPGAEPGTVPTDLEQSTGLERLEILGKMEGVDVFDMRPLDSSRIGTMDNPILVRSAGEEQFAGCTGSPAGSHNVIWLGVGFFLFHYDLGLFQICFFLTFLILAGTLSSFSTCISKISIKLTGNRVTDDHRTPHRAMP
jgi:hypothetical protein